MMIAAAGENEQSEIATAIETALLASLATINTQAENNSFVLVSRGSGGALAGGVIGHTSYGWLLIKVLWVDESHRGTGLGKQLMEQVEGRAREDGCHSAWLDTSSEPAHAFYRHMGYADSGLLVNGADQKPAGHHRRPDLRPRWTALQSTCGHKDHGVACALPANAQIRSNASV